MINALGLDVSGWQDDNSTPQKMDFLKAKTAVPPAEFVGIKASQACRADEDFLYNWKDAKDHGILRMAYHFMDWTKPAVDQADFFAGMIYKDPGEIYACLDYECRTGAPSAGTARLECKAFLERLYNNLDKKYYPIIYTGNNYWSIYGSADAYWERYPLWISHPYVSTPTFPKPWTTWLFWQWSWVGDGRKYGAESIGMDMDYFNGDSVKLHKMFGLTPPPQPAYDDHQKVEIMWAVMTAEGKV